MKTTLKTSEEFVKGKNDIHWVGEQFKDSVRGMKFVPAKSEGILTRTLGKQMNDSKILESLRPELVMLGDLLAHLKVADKDGRYIYYIRDSKGVLWAVSAYWDSGFGWDVGAYSVAGPGWWDAGCQVVSRGFSDSQEKTLRNSDTLTELTKRIEALEAWKNGIANALKNVDV